MRFVIAALIVGLSIQSITACEKKDEGKAKKLIAWIAKKFEPKTLETLRQEVEELLQNGNRSEAIQIVACHRERNKDLWMHLLLSIPEAELNCRMHGESNVHEITAYGYHEDYFILALLKRIKQQERRLAVSELESAGTEQKYQELLKNIFEHKDCELSSLQAEIGKLKLLQDEQFKGKVDSNDIPASFAYLLKKRMKEIERLSGQGKQQAINETNNEISMLLGQWNKRRTELSPEPVLPSVKFVLPGYAGKLPNELIELYDMLTNPEKYIKRNADFPRGILLYGPPGTGKTYVGAKFSEAVNAKFFPTTGSAFVEVYVGQGPKNVRDFFGQGYQYIKKNPEAKVILFIDEIDALGKRDNNSNNKEYDNTINEFIAQMDGFIKHRSVLVMGTTNHREKLDSTINQRFDVQVAVSLPNQESRKAVLEYHLNETPKDFLDPLIDPAHLASLTKNFSARQLADMVKKANRAAAHADTKLMQEYLLNIINAEKATIQSSSASESYEKESKKKAD